MQPSDHLCWIFAVAASWHASFSCSGLCVIFLPSAEPGIVPHITLPYQAGEEGLARACLQCLSGLARPYFCHLEIPLVVAFSECLHNLCVEISFLQHLPPPVNTQPCNNCSVFVVPLVLLWSKAGRQALFWVRVLSCFSLLWEVQSILFGTEIFINNSGELIPSVTCLSVRLNSYTDLCKKKK